jgi:hypothetical protein
MNTCCPSFRHISFLPIDFPFSLFFSKNRAVILPEKVATVFPLLDDYNHFHFILSEKAIGQELLTQTLNYSLKPLHLNAQTLIISSSSFLINTYMPIEKHTLELLMINLLLLSSLIPSLKLTTPFIHMMFALIFSSLIMMLNNFSDLLLETLTNYLIT